MGQTNLAFWHAKGQWVWLENIASSSSGLILSLGNVAGASQSSQKNPSPWKEKNVFFVGAFTWPLKGAERQMSSLWISNVRGDELPSSPGCRRCQLQNREMQWPTQQLELSATSHGEVFNDISETSLIYLEFTLKDYLLQCFQVNVPFEMLIRWNWPLPQADICISKRFLAHFVSLNQV